MCDCFIVDEFYHQLTREGKIQVFYSKFSIFHFSMSELINVIFWQCHLIINKSNLIAVIVFHQCTTGDTRGNLDLAVERQNHA